MGWKKFKHNKLPIVSKHFYFGENNFVTRVLTIKKSYEKPRYLLFDNDKIVFKTNNLLLCKIVLFTKKLFYVDDIWNYRKDSKGIVYTKTVDKKHYYVHVKNNKIISATKTKNNIVKNMNFLELRKIKKYLRKN